VSAVDSIPRPPRGFAGSATYKIRARGKRDFHGPLDASKLIDPSRATVITWTENGDGVGLTTEHPVIGGTIREELHCTANDHGLTVASFQREVHEGSGAPAGKMVRREHAPAFHHGSLGLPHATYPEVALPFLLGWMPFDGKRRSVYAWINDRFVAKVYVEVERDRDTITVPAGPRDVVQVVMYPDLNDWVPLGSMLTRLVKPFIPKYRMWFDRSAPHRVVRFEGPYGPPGAPELILELASTS
jgi:hypothetical protein